MQAAVFGWLQHPSATRGQLYRSLAQTGVEMSAPGFEARFTPAAVAFLRAMVEAAAEEVFEAEVLTPLLARFHGVYLTDGTRIDSPTHGLKVVARLELQRGALTLELEPLQRHDNASRVADDPLPRGALHVGDLGFFDLERFGQWAAEGVDWVTRYKAGVRLLDLQGNPIALVEFLQQQAGPVSLPVTVGLQRLPMLLVAQPVSEACSHTRCANLRHKAKRKNQPVSQQRLKLAGWTIYLTSRTDLNAAQVHVLYRARWQIERLFKRWKSLGQLNRSVTHNPVRQACEFYAKLLAVLLAHWLTQAFAWTNDHLSLDKVFVTLQTHALLLHAVWFRGFPGLDWLQFLLTDCRQPHTLSRRKTHPNTLDYLHAFDLLA